MVSNASKASACKDQMIINFMTNTLISKMLLVCQMSMTKPHIELGISRGLYINVANLCNLVIRYTFDRFKQKLTQYTSYEVMYIDSEVTHHD